jgi:hypothetical protein
MVTGVNTKQTLNFKSYSAGRGKKRRMIHSLINTLVEVNQKWNGAKSLGIITEMGLVHRKWVDVKIENPRTFGVNIVRMTIKEYRSLRDKKNVDMDTIIVRYH